MTDPDPERPCVADQEKASDSLLNYTRRLIKLRHIHPALGAEGKLHRIVSEYSNAPLIYERELDGERFLVAINPAAQTQTAEITLAGATEQIAGVGDIEIEKTRNAALLTMHGVSAGVFQIRNTMC